MSAKRYAAIARRFGKTSMAQALIEDEMPDGLTSFTISQDAWRRIQGRILDHVNVNEYLRQDTRMFLSQDEYKRRIQELGFSQWAGNNPDMLSRVMYANHLLNRPYSDLFFEAEEE